MDICIYSTIHNEPSHVYIYIYFFLQHIYSNSKQHTHIYIYIDIHTIPVVPHKAVAEVSKIGNLWEKLVVVNQGWQSEATDGLKGA